MNPKIESFIEQLYEAFPTLMTPDFVETLEIDLKNKLLHEQISFLKEEILPYLRERESSITEVKSTLPDKNYEENFEQNNDQQTPTETTEQEKNTKPNNNQQTPTETTEQEKNTKPNKHQQTPTETTEQEKNTKPNKHQQTPTETTEQEKNTKPNNNQQTPTETTEQEKNTKPNNNQQTPTETTEQDNNLEPEILERPKQDIQEGQDEDIIGRETPKEDKKPEDTDQTNEDDQEQLLLSGDELFNYLKEKLEDVSNISDLNKLIPEIKRLKNEEITKDSKALLCRKVGEVYLKHNCRKEALNSFKKALNYNPKVGVKRIFNKLKKELQ
ncbi:MAG: hypothetical protein FWH29_05580 [Methanobrevibacter sp.]|nr:hypothetical protein [Methanobrevibacter sp.]